jgi:hypothetical protein
VRLATDEEVLDGLVKWLESDETPGMLSKVQILEKLLNLHSRLYDVPERGIQIGNGNTQVNVF